MRDRDCSCATACNRIVIGYEVSHNTIQYDIIQFKQCECQFSTSIKSIEPSSVQVSSTSIKYLLQQPSNGPRQERDPASIDLPQSAWQFPEADPLPGSHRTLADRTM